METGALVKGIALTLPPLGLLVLCSRLTWPALKRLWQVIDDVVVPMFRNCNAIELAAIAILAGVGEELLFRGVFQTSLAEGLRDLLPPGAAAATADWIALAAVALLFGLLHALNRSYAVLAALMGLYLGWTWLLTDNLLVPMVAHAVYDFAAMLFILRTRSGDTG